MKSKRTLGIVGAGHWGQALAATLAKNPNNLILTWSLGDDIEKMRAADILFIVVPAQAVRSISEQIKTFSQVRAVICSKGIEQKTNVLMHEVMQEVLPHATLAVLSGPNFAHEVRDGLHAISTLASKDEKFLEEVSTLFLGSNLSIQTSNDMAGVELCGSLKNVYAIVCGAAHALQLGENMHAAIVTQALAEIGKFIKFKNGSRNTLLTAAGVGDVVLTCGSKTSRNFLYGHNFIMRALHDHKNSDADQSILVEGIFTLHAIKETAHNLQLSLVIALDDLLSHKISQSEFKERVVGLK